MTYSEASSAIKGIESEVKSFHCNLISFVSKLDSFANSVSQIDYETILHEQLITNINDTFGNINTDLKTIVSLCSSTYNTLVSDANRKIIEIVDRYNNSIKEDDEHKTYLSYITLEMDSFNVSSINNFN